MSNKIWILRPRIGLPKGNPWDPWYDKCFGKVVVAKDEEEARTLCAESANEYDEGKEAWLSREFSTCEEIDINEAAVIMEDIHCA